jgi:hypothetical protein
LVMFMPSSQKFALFLPCPECFCGDPVSCSVGTGTHTHKGNVLVGSYHCATHSWVCVSVAVVGMCLVQRAEELFCNKPWSSELMQYFLTPSFI